VLFVGLISVVLCAPFARYVGWLGDEGVLLQAAERMAQGSTIYVDFFEFLPPGGFVLTQGWFGIAGTSMLSARALATLTIAGIACFTYLACRQASKRTLLSVGIALGWMVISQGYWTQVSHHWFTTLFSMIAAWATLVSVEDSRHRLRGPLTAGIAAGAAIMVTPTRGALAMLAGATAVMNLRRYRAGFLAYVIACALIPISLIAYVIGRDAQTSAWDDVIVFTAKHYASVNPVPFGLWGNPYLTWIFPFAGLITLCVCVPNRRECLHDRVLRTCAAFGLAGFIGCFPRADGAHIGFAAPLVCPLLAYSLARVTWRWPAKFRYAAVAILCFVPAARWFWWKTYSALHAEIVATPRGRVSLAARGASEMAARIAATPSDHAFFFYPYMPMLAFLTARRQVSQYDVFVPGYTLPSQYQEACLDVMRSAGWVVIDRNWTDPKFLAGIFPAMRDFEPRETRRFEQALEAGFTFVARDGSFELRGRVPAVDESVCAGITGWFTLKPDKYPATKGCGRVNSCSTILKQQRDRRTTGAPSVRIEYRVLFTCAISEIQNGGQRTS